MPKYALLLPVALGLILTSCETKNKSHPDVGFQSVTPSRAPANALIGQVEAHNANDPFSADGYLYQRVDRQFEEGSQLPDDQLIKELAGREIWFKSAPNGHLHSYMFNQRMNAPIDWWKVLRTEDRDERFYLWGTINDPDCCTPGKDCEQKNMKFQGRAVTLKDTYGFDYCPGDDELLGYVGRADRDYRKADPACDHPVLAAADALDGGSRESRCELAFGTSTGVVGFRKYPNPRFNAAKWAKYNQIELAKKNKSWNGASWEGVSERLIDASIEPPYTIGIACASCHVAFDPSRPPKDPRHPEWRNLSGSVGNQYIQISHILGSGVPNAGAMDSSLEWQLFTHARPGVVDTSAIPHDYVGNPGTVNAIINFVQRPTFTDRVSRYVSESCSDKGDRDCQCITYKTGGSKCWKKRTEDMQVMHILKGGEDSVGADLAVQRVYVNIGMCAEQCWFNHLSDMRQTNPRERLYGQTPFDIYQCRRDCGAFRANEDRVGDILSYLLSRRPTDLKAALVNDGQVKGRSAAAQNSQFNTWLEERYGAGAVEQGRQIFAQNCASCHSSQNSASKTDLTPTIDNVANFDFLAVKRLDSGELVRADWFGNDKSTAVTEIGTNSCRAHHSNHLDGHVWQDFASETYRQKPAVMTSTSGTPVGGGRGYYRNISLLNAWAYAPFLHNNAIGPEICGRPTKANGGIDLSRELHRSTYEGTQADPKAKYVCDYRFDPSISARLEIFEKSVDELLTPANKRRAKIARADVPVRLPLGVRLSSLADGKAEKLYLEFPAGFPIFLIGNFDYKSFINDLRDGFGYIDDPAKWTEHWVQRKGETAGKEIATALLTTIKNFRAKPITAAKGVQGTILDNSNERLQIYMKYYSTCYAPNENSGHEFGTELSQDDKNALKAFLATL